jgi:glycosyltransferase involved in cell wall biosynthesis
MRALSVDQITAPPERKERALKVALLAPPWIPVPPPAYGGIEAVVALLCEELVASGHDITLFAAPGSRSPAHVSSPLGGAHPNEIGASLYESDHVSCAYDEIEQVGREGRPFDLVHDHSGFTAVALANRVAVPVVHTVHGPFNEATRPFYQRHAHKVDIVALSATQADSAPSGVRVGDVVPNPIRVEDWPFRGEKDDYLLWMGRMDPVKGAHRAITAAEASGHRLILAGPVQPGQEQYFREEIEPHLDGHKITFLGEVGGTERKQLFARARALLMPIRWAEPFGMVMVEALACGTPVIAFPEGAAGEIVIDGENGLHVSDEQAMAEATRSLTMIDPARCRASVVSRYHPQIVAQAYEAVYRRAIRAATQGIPRFAQFREPGRGFDHDEPAPRRLDRQSILQPAGSAR